MMNVAVPLPECHALFRTRKKNISAELFGECRGHLENFFIRIYGEVGSKGRFRTVRGDQGRARIGREIFAFWIYDNRNIFPAGISYDCFKNVISQYTFGIV